MHVASYAHYIRLTRNVLMRYAYPYVGYAHALMGMCAHVRPTLGIYTLPTSHSMITDRSLLPLVSGAALRGKSPVRAGGFAAHYHPPRDRHRPRTMYG